MDHQNEECIGDCQEFCKQKGTFYAIRGVLNETKGVSWTSKVSMSKFRQFWIIFGHLHSNNNKLINQNTTTPIEQQAEQSLTSIVEASEKQNKSKSI